METGGQKSHGNRGAKVSWKQMGKSLMETGGQNSQERGRWLLFIRQGGKTHREEFIQINLLKPLSTDPPEPSRQL